MSSKWIKLSENHPISIENIQKTMQKFKIITKYQFLIENIDIFEWKCEFRMKLWLFWSKKGTDRRKTRLKEFFIALGDGD